MTTRKSLPVPSRREEIIAIATRLFVERGHAEVSTRLIARAANISQPTLYSHFSGKDELLDEICCRWFEVLHARLARAAAFKGTPVERLRRGCRSYIDLAWGQPDQYFIAFVLPGELGGELPRSERFRTKGQKAYQVLKDLVAPFAGDAREAEALGQSVWCTLHGAATLVIWRPGFGWVERKRLLEQQLDLICGGIRRNRSRD